MLAATHADWDTPSQARAVHDELVARAAEASVQATVLAWSPAAGGLNDNAVKLGEQARPRHRRSPGGTAHRRRHHAGGVDDMKGSYAFGAHPREVARVLLLYPPSTNITSGRWPARERASTPVLLVDDSAIAQPSRAAAVC